MDFLHIVYSIVLIIVFFGGSIFVHEFGHYLAARRRGLKVERFSIGFGPKIWSFMRDGVEWCVCALPLGGYVALPQLADLEGIEGKYEGEKLAPISYTDTLVVAVMGVVFNIIFAFVLGCLLWVVGRPVPVAQNTTIVGTAIVEMVENNGAKLPGPAAAAGILPGDVLVEIDGMTVKNWREVKQAIITSAERDKTDNSPLCQVKVLRGGKTLDFTTHPILFGNEKLRSIGIIPYEELFVEKVSPNSPAARAGLQKGDQITAIGGQKLYDYYDYATLTENLGTATTSLTYLRGGQEYSVNLAPELVKIDKEGQTAPEFGMEFQMQTEIIHQDPISQIVDAAVLTWRTLTTLVNPSSDIKITHMSGPPGIAWMIHRLSGDIRQLLFFIVLINVNLAILNLLPLPVLDGGQIVIATVNKLRGKSLPVKWIAGLQNAFAVLLLLLMAYIICFADVPRVGREWKEENAFKKAQSDQIEPVFQPVQINGEVAK